MHPSRAPLPPSATATRGAVAAGHPQTAEAARQVLADGGNAFDAVLAALVAACVAEPVLASLGGGGFLLAHPADRPPVVYDFFTHTPREAPRDAAHLHFYPIVGDFGATQQEFHVGRASIATPGVIRGLFEIHRDLGSRPMARLLAPAVALARDGVTVNGFQAFANRILRPILTSNPEVLALFARSDDSGEPAGELAAEGDVVRTPELADFLEALAKEGDRLFYEGPPARALAELCRQGGFLTLEDLKRYRVERRKPIERSYRGARVWTNPLPSCGGSLIAFGLSLLEDWPVGGLGFGSAEHLALLVEVFALTRLARRESGLDEPTENPRWHLHEPAKIAEFRELLRRDLARPLSTRGTTHVSVVDAAGNVASLTLSNGEGSGVVLPSTGIQLNNMLGEEDLNPRGFHLWPADHRLSSMMAPSVLELADGTLIALGSGGSNRLRTAILQVLVNLLDFGMTVTDAVASPRLHLEGRVLKVEPGLPERSVAAAEPLVESVRRFDHPSLYFGGVHAAGFEPGGRRFLGAGDPRRGGVVLYA